MSQSHCTTTPRTFKHLTERERYQIEILLKEKKKPGAIAKALGKHKRTIEREIGRGTVRMLNYDLSFKDKYCADAGQRIYLTNATNKGAGLKIGRDHKLAQHIENKIINEKYSPDAVIGEIRAKGLEFQTSICTKTLYNYIDKEVFVNITNKDLAVKRTPKKGNYKRTRIAHNNLKGTSIEARPASVEAREEYGHWEMDCVVSGKGSKAALLVLTERMTRQQIIRKMPNKTQQSVQKELDKLERAYGSQFYTRFKTVTVDNGAEFLDSDKLERSARKQPGLQRFKLYYAHPYSAWERGSNENANKLIRRFIPKGADIGKFKHKDIQRIENWMNNYPRRIHGYNSANEMAA